MMVTLRTPGCWHYSRASYSWDRYPSELGIGSLWWIGPDWFDGNLGFRCSRR